MRKVKNKKFSIKKTLRLIIPLLIIIILLINKNNILTLYQSKITGYSSNTIVLMHKLNIYKDVKKYKYSETLEKIINTEYFDKNYVLYYIGIDYYDDKDYFKNINKLISLGYTSDEINIIYKNLSKENINTLLENDYLKDISNILKLTYFRKENLNRYINYNKDNNLEYENLITYVNIGLDKDYYTDIENVDDPENILVLVNKYHALDSNYVPKDLETISSKYNRGAKNQMRTIAKKAFEEMCEAALKDGITIYSGSAYRSYSYQLSLYNRYVAADGKITAETYAARAGHSEHQTGLATDIMNANLNFISGSDKEFDWLVNNSYKYGFILRYPKGKENITGYMYEEWHFRYLGVDVATEVYNLDITYDEYVARQ